MYLSDRTGGRDNHFNLIRFAAAMAVLVTHSFALAVGSPDAEPLWTTYGMSLGSIAVDVFFVTSGFLVTGSLLTRGSVVEFVIARSLRIFPALWVMLIVVTLGAGLLITNVPWVDYLSSPRTQHYVIKNASLFWGLSYSLPGLFENNPVSHNVNGSLWTMQAEVRMYAALLLVWAFSWIAGQYRAIALRVAITAICAFSAYHLTLARLTTPDLQWPRLMFAFFTGGAFYVFKEKIFLSRRLLVFLLVVMAIACQWRDAFYFSYTLSITYVVLYLAHHPARTLLGFNRMGDYSYGVYIYAFPIQQALLWLSPGLTPMALMLGSGTVTLMFAATSWRCIEKPALARKAAVAKFVEVRLRAVTQWVAAAAAR